MVLEDDGLVEALDERAAVVAGRQDAVVLELDDGLLDRHPAQAELLGDLVAVDPIAGAQLASKHQVDDVRNDLVLFFDSIPLGHSGASFSRHCAVVRRLTE